MDYFPNEARSSVDTLAADIPSVGYELRSEVARAGESQRRDQRVPYLRRKQRKRHLSGCYRDR